MELKMIELDLTTETVTDMALIEILLNYQKSDEVLDAVDEIKGLFIDEPDKERCKEIIGGYHIDSIPRA
jgi:hypothetical protein